MYVEAAVVLDKWFITQLMRFNPVADVFAQLGMVRWRAIHLIGQRPKQAVTVAECGCGIKAQRSQLLGEQLCVLCRIRQELGT